MQHNSFQWWLALGAIYLIGILLFRRSDLIALSYLFYTNTGLNPDANTLWRSIKHTKHSYLNKEYRFVSPLMSVSGIVNALFAASFSVSAMVLFICIGWSLQYVFIFLYLSILLLLSYVDRYTFLLPDALIVPLIILGITNHILFNYDQGFYTPIFGFLAGFFILFVLNAIWFTIYNKRGFGAGDLKFLASIGVWSGANSIPIILFIACLTNALFAIVHQRSLKPSGYYPFGPFIAIGAIVTLIYSKCVLI